MNNSQHQNNYRGAGLIMQFGVLLMTFFIGLIIVVLIKPGIDSMLPLHPRDAFLIVSVMQCLLVFILPAWLMAKLSEPAPMRWLGVTTSLKLRQFFGVTLALFILLPLINYLMAWNSGWVFPESLNSLESQLREWEDTAADTTSMILGSSSVWALISGILVIGVLTGLSEECFFRAGMQRSLVAYGVNHHQAIFIIAFIFSAFHFQFYGFVPRFVLGAFFGYLYYYSGSLWVSAFAHALNNSLVVVSAWVAANGGDISYFESIGTSSIVWPLVSLSLFVLFAIFLWKPLLHKPAH